MGLIGGVKIRYRMTMSRGKDQSMRVVVEICQDVNWLPRNDGVDFNE